MSEDRAAILTQIAFGDNLGAVRDDPTVANRADMFDADARIDNLLNPPSGAMH